MIRGDCARCDNSFVGSTRLFASHLSLLGDPNTLTWQDAINMCMNYPPPSIYISAVTDDTFLLSATLLKM